MNEIFGTFTVTDFEENSNGSASISLSYSKDFTKTLRKHFNWKRISAKRWNWVLSEAITNYTGGQYNYEVLYDNRTD